MRPRNKSKDSAQAHSSGPLASQLTERFPEMSGQLQLAARFMLDRPDDVALWSMRKQAREAGVQPATMTRLAQYLGFSGYEEIRTIYMESVRKGAQAFASRGSVQVAKQKLEGDNALIEEIAHSLSAQIAKLADPITRTAFVGAAETIAACRRIYCIGLRASFATAWHARYLLSLVRDGALLLDAPGGIESEALRDATSEDVLLAITVHPYTRATVDIVDNARRRRMQVVVITDSPVSPIAVGAKHCILVGTDSASFLPTMTPCYAAAELLAALVAGRGGEKAVENLRRVVTRNSSALLFLAR